MRDHATVEQLLVLDNIESMNAEFIHKELEQVERLKRLNQISIRQMQTLTPCLDTTCLPIGKEE